VVCSIGMVYASFAFPGQPHMMLEGCSPGLLPVTVPSRGWYSCAPSDRSSSENQHVPSLPVVRVDCCLQIFALPRPLPLKVESSIPPIAPPPTRKPDYAVRCIRHGGGEKIAAQHPRPVVVMAPLFNPRCCDPGNSPTRSFWLSRPESAARRRFAAASTSTITTDRRTATVSRIPPPTTTTDSNMTSDEDDAASKSVASKSVASKTEDGDDDTAMRASSM